MPLIFMSNPTQTYLIFGSGWSKCRTLYEVPYEQAEAAFSLIAFQAIHQLACQFQDTFRDAPSKFLSAPSAPSAISEIKSRSAQCGPSAITQVLVDFYHRGHRGHRERRDFFECLIYLSL